MIFKIISNFFIKLQTELARESIETQTMLIIYSKLTIGTATDEEIKFANNQLKNIFKNIGVGTLLIIPFGIPSLYLLIKIANKLNIDILPDWYKSKRVHNELDIFSKNTEIYISKLNNFIIDIVNFINKNSTVLIYDNSLKKEIIKQIHKKSSSIEIVKNSEEIITKYVLINIADIKNYKQLILNFKTNPENKNNILILYAIDYCDLYSSINQEDSFNYINDDSYNIDEVKKFLNGFELKILNYNNNYKYIMECRL